MIFYDCYTNTYFDNLTWAKNIDKLIFAIKSKCFIVFVLRNWLQWSWQYITHSCDGLRCWEILSSSLSIRRRHVKVILHPSRRCVLLQGHQNSHELCRVSSLRNNIGFDINKYQIIGYIIYWHFEISCYWFIDLLYVITDDIVNILLFKGILILSLLYCTI